ncbi:MAG: PLP-dependent aminotransferase family protein, partial [Geminicoccaceae bacterium]
VARLKSGGDDRAISRAAGELGVQAPALSTYFQGQPYATGLVLGYAGVDRETIKRSTATLLKAMERA